MTGKSRQLIMLAASLTCFVVAGGYLYQHAELLQRQFGFHHNAEVRVNPQPATATNRTMPSDSAPPIPRPKRPIYPDRPTVAVLDFGVDRDTYLGEQTAIELTELIRQLLADDPAYMFVERSEIARVRQEHELGLFLTANPTDRLELGCWLKAHLIVTGRFVDEGEPTQALSLSVIDTVTAERVVKRRIDFDQPLRDPTSIRSEQVEKLADETRGMLAETHQKLLKARDARVVSLLFFRNVGKTDRLTHLEFSLPQRLAELAESDPSVRLVQLHDPTLAMDEQELMLIGLSADNTDAWQTAADYYLWGLIEEREPAAKDESPVEIDPGDLPVDITLVLWHGYGDPVEIKETAPAREVDLAVERASRRAWSSVTGELPDQISPSSRDKIVTLLMEPPDKLEVTLSDGPESWQVRRLSLYLDRLRLAWFLDPKNGYLGNKLGCYFPETGIDQPWSYLQRANSLVDRVIRRHGLLAYATDGKLPTRVDRIRLNERLVERKASILEDMADAVVNPYASFSVSGGERPVTQRNIYVRLQPPDDMPNEARFAVHEQVAQALARFGRELSGTLASDVFTDERRDQMKRGFFNLADDVINLIEELKHAGALSRIHAFEAWWPILEYRRFEQLAKAENDSNSDYVREHYRNELAKIGDVFAEAGLSERYQARYNTLPERLAARSVALSTSELSDEVAASLKAEVTELRSKGLLREPLRPSQNPARTPRPQLPVRPAASASHPSLERMLAEGQVPEELRDQLQAKLTAQKQSIEYNRKLQRLRYLDPEASPDSEPRHPDAPLIQPSGLPATWFFHDVDDHALHSPESRPNARIGRLTWSAGRFLAKAEINNLTLQGHRLHYPLDVLAYNPIPMSLEPVLIGLPASTTMTDMACVGKMLWLTTTQQGLVRYDPQTHTYTCFTGEHGLPSRNLIALTPTRDYLVVTSKDEDLSILSNLDAPIPTVRDLKIPDSEGFAKDRLDAIGNRLLVNGSNPYWFDLETRNTVDVKQWLKDHVPEVDDQEEVIWTKGVGEYYWVLMPDRLIRIGSDLELFDVFKAPIPPLEDMVMHDDGRHVWFAYAWTVYWPELPKSRLNTLDPPTPPIMASRVVAWLPGAESAAGQWQVEGKVTGIDSANGELYVISQALPQQMRVYHRASLLRQMGISEPDDDRRSITRDMLTGDINEVERAAFFGDVKTLEDHLAHNRDWINQPGLTHWTPLMFAIRGGHAEAVRLLLDAGANPNHVTLGVPMLTPTILAANMDRPDLLSLLADHGARLDLGCPLYGLPVHAAIQYRAYASLPWLIEHHAPIDREWNYYDSPESQARQFEQAFWSRPLLLAIQRDDMTALSLLLDAGVNPSGLTNVTIESIPLSYAIHLHRADMLPRLLEAGADVHQPYVDYYAAYPPLYVAFDCDDLRAAKLLVDAGAIRQDSPPFLLVMAIHAGSQELIELMLQQGMSLNTAFVKQDHRIGYPQKHGNTTPAQCAILSAHIDLYDWMLNDVGLDLDLPVGKARQGDLLASALASTGQYERAIDLVSQGYSINYPQGKFNWTPLMSAAKAGRVEEVELLLRLGADPNMKDKDGKRAIDLTQDPTIRQMLRTRE